MKAKLNMRRWKALGTAPSQRQPIPKEYSILDRCLADESIDHNQACKISVFQNLMYWQDHSKDEACVTIEEPTSSTDKQVQDNL